MTYRGVESSPRSLVVVAGADPKRWQLAQRVLGRDFTVAFAIDIQSTLDVLSRRQPALLLLCSDCLDSAAGACISRVRAQSAVPIAIVLGAGTTACDELENPNTAADARSKRSIVAVRAIDDDLLGVVREMLGGPDTPTRRAARDPIEVGLKDLPVFREMVLGTSAAMRRALHMLRKVARVDVTVLLSGETGTGKELFARRLHCLSDRARGPFRAVNLPAVPKDLFESTLFGHERGSFTGAVTQTSGAFEQAHEGTLFLDEISSMDLHAQPKLLRAIQEKEIERVGGREAQRCDTRLVAATNTDLLGAVERQEFREDLYHRLAVVTIDIPPLRRRAEDIPLLVEFFLTKYTKRFGGGPREISRDAMDALMRHEWTGNVRELENRVQKAVLLSDNTPLRAEDFFPDRPSAIERTLHFGACTWSLAEVEHAYIEEVLARSGGNQSRAAQTLGIDRKTLRSRRQKADRTAEQTKRLMSVS